MTEAYATVVFLFVLFGALLIKRVPVTTSSKWRSRCLATSKAAQPKQQW